MSLPASAQILLPQHFESAKWGRNPLTHPQPREIDAHFVIETGKNERFRPFLQIMPNEFRLTSGYHNPEVRKLLDLALQRILMTPTGKTLCQRATQGDWKRIRYYFGMSEDASKIMADHCKSDTSSELIIKLSYIHEWILIETTDPNFPIHGWTTPKNVSFLFFARNDFTEVNFYRTLIHELATALDSKESWGMLGKLNLAPKITKVTYNGLRECEVIAAMKRPTIKYAGSVLRAEIFENQVLAEMGLITPKPTQAESCASKILRKIPSVLAIGDIVSADSFVGKFDVRMCGVDPNQSRSLFDDLELLEAEKAFDLEFEKEMSICEFLITPRVDSYFIGPYTGGPRPKVEPWDQQRVHEDISQKLIKDYNDKSSQSAKALQSGQMLERLKQIEESRSELGRIPDRQNQLRDLLKLSK